VPAGDISSQVQIFDDKIKTERDNIEAARKALKQMDAQVDEKLSRTTDDRGAERAVQIRRNQSKERNNLQKTKYPPHRKRFQHYKNSEHQWPAKHVK
jgi:hypothetical protein